MSTAIEWVQGTDGERGKTWNPIVGCDIVSAGCTDCYAMKQAARIERMNPNLAHYRGLTKLVNGKPVWTGNTALAVEKLDEPLRRRKPTTWFVNSMSDLFYEEVPDNWVDAVFAIMAASPQHTFQVLTKRADRLRRYLTDQDTPERIAKLISRKVLILPAPVWPLKNLWLGVSAERQQEFDLRWPELEATQAVVRFVSYEPMLGPLDIGAARPDWLIAGCESLGPRAGRPYDLAWVLSIRDQCQAAGTAFFLKQLGVDGRIVSLPHLDGRQWAEFPAVDRTRAAA